MTENKFYSGPASQQDSGVLPLRVEQYLEYLQDCELTEAQKVEFLQTLWDIMATFVRLGFDLEYALPILLQKASENGENALEQSIPTHEFNAATADEESEKEEAP
ncbi:hypothetical protein [Eoetvoesiella caeni]